MPGLPRRHRLPLVGAVTLVLLAAGTAPVEAHDHPTPIERAAPGVVFVEARAKVEVALIEHRQVGDEFGIHIGIVQSTWNPVLSAASGFFVDPNGAIVTAGSITAQDLDRAKVYAVNQAFHQRYGAAAPLPRDPFAQQHIGPASNRNEQRLQACYPPNRTNDAGGCVIRATLDVVVYPYVTSQQRYGTLRAEVLPGGTKDVAVLRVRGANSMPTVAVARSTAGASALGVLGFTGVPGPKSDLLAIDQHLQQKGGTALRTTPKDAKDRTDAAALKQALGRGIAGGPVVAESGQVIGMIPAAAAAGQAAPKLVTATTIQQVLKAARVAPHGSPVDNSYEAAMHLFKNGGYAAAIPQFTRALQLFPGHYRASANLAVAKARAGTGGAATPAPTSTGSGSATATSGVQQWLLVALALGALVAALVALVLRGRQRRASAKKAPAAVPSTFRAAPVPAGKMSSARHAPGAPGSPAAGDGTRAGQRAAASTVRGPAKGGPASPSQARTPHTSAARASTASASPAPVATPPGPLARGREARGSETRGSESHRSTTGGRFCTSCGAQLAPQHRFCGSCGEPVG